MDISPLINLGAVGVVLAWFMIRAETKLDALVRAVNRLALSQVLDVLNRPGISPETKRQARILEQDIKSAQKAHAVDEAGVDVVGE